MKITCAKYMLTIDIVENQVPVLVIEHPGIFADFIGSFFQQCEGSDGDILLSEGEKVLKMSSSAMIVMDYFSLNFNSRQIQNRLYQQLKTEGTAYNLQKDAFTQSGIALIDALISSGRFDHIDYSLDLEWTDIFKLFQVRVETTYVTLQEKLLSFLRVCAELLNIKVLALVNLRAYVSREELLEIYRMAGYLKLPLLMIESSEGDSLPMERYFIIDKDKCLIIK